MNFVVTMWNAEFYARMSCTLHVDIELAVMSASTGDSAKVRRMEMSDELDTKYKGKE